MGVTVNKPGICTTVQDLGRRGYLGSGFSPSGVMDKRAARIANLLVDNDENAPVLEICLAGPTLRFTTNTCIALTGGNFSPTVDGAAIPMYAAIMVHRGSVLEFGAPKTGVYGYLAIAGGSIAVPKVMGSASTNLKCGIGGWEGRALSAGDYLPFVTNEGSRLLLAIGGHVYVNPVVLVLAHGDCHRCNGVVHLRRSAVDAVKWDSRFAKQVCHPVVLPGHLDVCEKCPGGFLELGKVDHGGEALSFLRHRTSFTPLRVK